MCVCDAIQREKKKDIEEEEEEEERERAVRKELQSPLRPRKAALTSTELC